jgi:hypothetical protein
MPPPSSHDATGEEVAAGGITPELALVSPELAEAGRAQLPSKPWEAAAGQPSTAHARHRRRSITKPRSGRGWGKLAVLAVALFGAALLVVGVLLDSPSTRPSATEPPRSSAQGAGSRVSVPKAGAATGRKTPAEGEKRGAGKEGTKGTTGVAKPSLQPRGGYVVSPSGSLSTNASGRAIETFVLPLACAGRPLVLSDVPVTARSFTFAGRADAGPTVRLRARVVDRGHIRGVVSADGPGCPSAGVSFQARLS